MRPILLTGDFYRWKKEREQVHGRTTNCILFYMRRGMAEKDAVARVEENILKLESVFLRDQDNFCRAHIGLPSHLKMMVNILAPLIGGYHYWSCCCPRYNSVQDSTLDDTRLDEIKDSCMLNYLPSLHLAERLRQTGKPIEHSSHIVTPKLNRNPLEAPITYIKSLSSKNVRLQLIDAFNLWFGLPLPALNLVKEVVSDLHNSSLILDDIQDGSSLRRGSKAAHTIFGNAQSINSATYIFVRVAKHIHTLSNHNLMTVLLEELETLFLGQSWELKWRFMGYCPSEEEYFTMVDCKTGAMFHMLLRLMLTFTCTGDGGNLSQNTSFDLLAQLMGRWYQVRDDYLNLQDAEYTKKKGFAEDLDEGKFSYPVVRCCADPLYKDMVMGILLRRDRAQAAILPVESKLYILELMNKAGAIEATWQMIMQLQEGVEMEITRLEALLGESNPILRVLVKVLASIPRPSK